MANPSNEQSPLERDQNACIGIDETQVRHFDETETATSFSVKDNRVLCNRLGGRVRRTLSRFQNTLQM